MKQEKFIELLNLYVDGELSGEQAAELESEIARDPERRQVYRQYCQMQRACTVLAERFRHVAAPAAMFRGGGVVRTASPRRDGWLRPAAWVASGAVAACFAFVAVRSQLPGTAPTVATTPTPATVLAVATKGTQAPVVAVRPVLFRNPWSATPAVPPRMPDWQQLPLSEQNPTLVVPPLSEFPDSVDAAAPSAKAEGEPPALVIEEVGAAAFQYQR